MYVTATRSQTKREKQREAVQAQRTLRWQVQVQTHRNNWNVNWSSGRGEGYPVTTIGTLCRELCKNGGTDCDAVWDAESGGSRESCFIWSAHWRNLANTIETSVCGGDAPYVNSSYFDHLFSFGLMSCNVSSYSRIWMAADTHAI